MKRLLIFFPLLALLFSCKKDDPYNVPDPVSNRIRFDALAVGQVSRYIGLTGSYLDNNYFEYSDDTLQLEIIAKDDKGYKVKETLRYVGYVSNWLDWEKDSVFFYYLRIKDDTLFVKPANSTYLNSSIFTYRISKFGFSLKKITSPEVEILGWKTSFPSWTDRYEGYTEGYTLFGKTYDHLNVIVENTPMESDGQGETYVFSKSAGIVRFSTYSPWTQKGYGWDLLPEN